MSASASNRFAALQPISMGLAGLYGSTAAGAARGLALRMDHGSQYLGPLHQPDQVLGHPAVLRLRSLEPQTNGVAERFNRTTEGTDHPWSHLPQHRGKTAGRRPRLRQNSTMPSGSSKSNGYLSPAQKLVRRWHACDLNQARRVRQTCVQGTGCATHCANDLLAAESVNGPMRKMHEAFRKNLIEGLDEDGFADMFAQTIAYGLLAARISRQSGGLVTDNLTDMVPKTNPFLKELFETFLSLGGRWPAPD